MARGADSLPTGAREEVRAAGAGAQRGDQAPRSSRHPGEPRAGAPGGRRSPRKRRRRLLSAAIRDARRDHARIRRGLAEAERVEHLVDEGVRGVAHVPALLGEELVRADVDGAAAGVRPREGVLEAALGRRPAVVEEDVGEVRRPRCWWRSATLRSRRRPPTSSKSVRTSAQRLSDSRRRASSTDGRNSGGRRRSMKNETGAADEGEGSDAAALLGGRDARERGQPRRATRGAAGTLVPWLRPAAASRLDRGGESDRGDSRRLSFAVRHGRAAKPFGS